MWFLILISTFVLVALIYHNSFTLPTSMKKLFTLVAQRPSPITLRLGPVVFVTIHKPEHMQIVLNSPYCLDKSFIYQFFRVDRGLFAAPANIWKNDRKAFSPSFGPTILRKATPIFNEKIAICVQQMESHVGREHDFVEDVGRCLMDALMVIAFGTDLDLQRVPEGKQYIEMFCEFIQIVTERIYKPWTHPEFLYRFTKTYRRECKILESGYAIFDKIIRDKGKYAFNETEECGPKIFIDKLLELNFNAGGDIQHLRDHLVTLVLAGSETTMSVTASVILMLAIHQDIQERVHQELMQVIASDPNESISQESVAKLTYLEMVCKETMRLFPVAGLAAREASKDIVLDDNFTIPANAIVCTMFYQLHRDPKIWGPHADQFDPERFRPEVASQRHPYAYLPFMGGTRMCPGQRYAWLAMKIMLGHVLRKFHLRTSLTMKDICVNFLILMRIEQGCPVTLTVR